MFTLRSRDPRSISYPRCRTSQTATMTLEYREPNLSRVKVRPTFPYRGGQPCVSIAYLHMAAGCYSRSTTEGLPSCEVRQLLLQFTLLESPQLPCPQI